MNKFKIGEKVEFVKDLTEELEVESHPEVEIGSIGIVRDIMEWYSGDLCTVGVTFPQSDQKRHFFFPDELESIDRPYISSLKIDSLEIAKADYLAALSGMTTARKQMADLSLDRYLPEAVRESLEETLSNKLTKFGGLAEDAISRMTSILEEESSAEFWQTVEEAGKQLSKVRFGGD